MKSEALTLVISGGRDPMFTKEMGEALTECFSLGQHLHLPQAGHLLIAEYPDIINGAIAELIERFSDEESS